MLSRSLTSCLIKPIANDFVFVINSICSLKRSVHTEGYTPLGATRGLSRYMEMEVYGVFPHSLITLFKQLMFVCFSATGKKGSSAIYLQTNN